MLSLHDLFAAERKTHIARLVDEHGKATVAELCSMFRVSAATVRTDLRDLQQAGVLVRTHGGAIRRGKTGFELDSLHREVQNLVAKRAIATAAAAMVEEGDRIILDTGTTTYQLALALRGRRNITIVTNDLEIARVMEGIETAHVILLGGTIRKGFHFTVGSPGPESLGRLSVDKVFLATNSLSRDRGATTPDLRQADSKRAMLAAAQTVILLCDHSKLDKVSFAQFASLDQIDALVCDCLPPRWNKALKDKGVDVILP